MTPAEALYSFVLSHCVVPLADNDIGRGSGHRDICTAPALTSIAAAAVADVALWE